MRAGAFSVAVTFFWQARVLAGSNPLLLDFNLAWRHLVFAMRNTLCECQVVGSVVKERIAHDTLADQVLR
jgi:hypothetical protein